jgi:hypothetical protein
MFGYITRAFTVKIINVNSCSVDTIHEYIPFIFFWPSIATQINHCSGMSMSTSCRCGSKVPSMRTSIPYPVNMVCNGLDIVIGIRVKMLPSLSVIAGSLYHMEQMGDYTYSRKGMAIFVEVDSPGITGSLRKNLKLMTYWMVPPIPCIDLLSFFIRITRLTYI